MSRVQEGPGRQMVYGELDHTGARSLSGATIALTRQTIVRLRDRIPSFSFNLGECSCKSGLCGLRAPSRDVITGLNVTPGKIKMTTTATVQPYPARWEKADAICRQVFEVQRLR